MRSASTKPSSAVTTVPSGTLTTRSAPSAPLRFEPEPCLPLPARRTRRRCAGRRPLREHAHGAAATVAAERDIPADQSEQGVVLAAADTGPRVEVGPALAHDDLAGVDLLAAEALDAEPLRVRIAAVPA